MGFHTDPTGVLEGWIFTILFKASQHTLATGSVRPSTVRSQQDCLHSQILQRRQQWPYCEIARGTTSLDTVIVIARFSPRRFAESFNGTS